MKETEKILSQVSVNNLAYHFCNPPTSTCKTDLILGSTSQIKQIFLHHYDWFNTNFKSLTQNTHLRSFHKKFFWKNFETFRITESSMDKFCDATTPKSALSQADFLLFTFNRKRKYLVSNFEHDLSPCVIIIIFK